MTDRALITKCLATFPCRALESVHSGTSRDQSTAKELSFRKINLSITLEKYWMEKVVPTLGYFVTMFVTYTSSIFILFNISLQVLRLYLLLTTKESAINVPSNLDARRRITFFANSLFMNMPRAPKVRDMFSFRLVVEKCEFYKQKYSG